MALAWLLGRPTVASVILGARTEDQLRANLASAGLELSAEERTRLNKISLPRLIYPHWHQKTSIADRLGAGAASLMQDHLPD